MGLSRYRNRRCPCGSGKKFKYCCLLKHYEKASHLVTPIQIAERAKTAKWYQKKYKRMITKPVEEQSNVPKIIAS